VGADVAFSGSVKSSVLVIKMFFSALDGKFGYGSFNPERRSILGNIRQS